MGRLDFVTKDRWVAPVSFLLLLIAYHLVFGQFFPTRNGTLGNDYSGSLPDLLSGYFWFINNDLFEPFWFTPAFCGGEPALGEPMSTNYSVTQLMMFFFTPITSIYATVLLFASLGFWSFYLLLRSCFGTSRQAATLGGALFMFNGFFIHRMMIGHIQFHGAMLIPLIAWFLLRSTRQSFMLGTLRNGAVVGCIFAYGVYSGLSSALLPCAATVLAIICMHRLAGREPSGFVQNSLVAALVAIGLSAAKLSAVFSFLHNFPRSDYFLPGVTGIWNALHLLFNALFLAPADIAQQAQPLLANLQWVLERHEWEYGVTVVPLLTIFTGTAVILVRMHGTRPWLSPARWAWLVLLGFILALPFALNIYLPDWNAFLKQVPLIKSSSNLLRWFLIYIPIVVLMSALLLDRISQLASRRNGMLMAALVTLVLINVLKDHNYYHSQNYRPDTIVNAWRAVHTGTILPRIQYIGAFVDANNRVQLSGNRNDMIAAGGSQLACYNSTFGYRLEHFPVKTLHIGQVMEETNGMLNIKNPACYLYPEQNNCTPGDHFTVDQREAAQAFASYKPFPFNFSTEQKIANWMTQVTLVLLAVLFAMTVILSLRDNAKKRGHLMKFFD